MRKSEKIKILQRDNEKLREELLNILNKNFSMQEKLYAALCEKHQLIVENSALKQQLATNMVVVGKSDFPVSPYGGFEWTAENAATWNNSVACEIKKMEQNN